MTVPTDIEWAVSAKVNAHTAILAQIDGGRVRVRSAIGQQLCVFYLNSPAGVVDPLTGTITLDGSATTVSNPGTPAYGELCEGDGTVVASMPCAIGSAPVANRLTVNANTLIVNTPINLLPSTIG